MTSPSSRSRRSCRSPRSSRACPSRRRGPRRTPRPWEPGPSNGSRSPCRRNRDGDRSRAPPRTTMRAGFRSLRTPGPVRPQATPDAPGTARSSSGSAPYRAPPPYASARTAPASPRAAPSRARPGTAADRTRKSPAAPGCGPAPEAETGSRDAGTRCPRSARATSPSPGRRCARGPRPASRSGATSRVMCQGERGAYSLCFVFVDEDGEEDAVH